MRKGGFIGFVLVPAFVALAALHASARDVPLLSVSTEITARGTELSVIETPQAPAVAVRLYLPGGVLAEEWQAGSGLAFTALQFWRDALPASGLGPTNRACVGRAEITLDNDGLCFSILTTRERLEDSLRALAELVSVKSISDETWQRLRERVAHQLMSDQQDAAYQLRSLYHHAVNAWNPLGVPMRGDLRQFMNVSKQDVLAYCNRVRASANVKLIIAGEVNPSEAVAKAAEALAGLPQGNALVWPRYDEPMQPGARWIERSADVSQSWVCVAFQLGREGDEDTPAYDVMLRLLRRDRERFTAALRTLMPSVGGLDVAEDIGPRGERAMLVTFQAAAAHAPVAARVAAEWFRDARNRQWDETLVRQEIAAMQVKFLATMTDPEVVARVTGAAILRNSNPQYPMLRATGWTSVTPDRVARAAATAFCPAKTITVVVRPQGGDPNVIANERQLLDAAHFPTRKVVLDNGAIVLLRRNPRSPLVRFVFGAIGGLWCEQVMDNGMFSLVGETMRFGSRDTSSDAFAKACRDMGLMVRADSHAQDVTLAGIVAPDRAIEAAPLLCAAWATPNISKDSLRAAVDAVAARINVQRLDAPGLADWLFRAALFSSQPYRMNTLGSVPLLGRLVVDDVRQIHSDFMSPRATTLLVDGDFDEAAMEAAIRKAWRKYIDQPKSPQFLLEARGLRLASVPPCLMVNLQPEQARTGSVSRIFTTTSSDALIACGIPAPSSDETNYPPRIVHMVRGALLQSMDALRAQWVDEDNVPVMGDGGAVACDLYGTAWAYAFARVPAAQAREAAKRIEAAVQNALRGLADGTMIDAARARAIMEYQLDTRYADTVLEQIMFDHLFGRTERLPHALNVYLDRCGTDDCAQLVKEYGTYPVTVVAIPRQ